MRSAVSIRLAAALAALAMVTAACGGSTSSDAGAEPENGENGTEETAARGGTLNIGLVQDIENFDSAMAHVGHRLQPFQAAYDTLIRRLPDGELAPMLATEWEYLDEDKLQLQLTLRDDVTFSDGAPFDAEAVRANLEQFQEANGPQAAQLASLASVEVVDATTVVLELSSPNPAMEYFLSQAAGLMGSPEQLGSPEIARTPVGTGPYVMDAAGSVTGSVYRFEAREDYWAPELQRFDEIVMTVLTDPAARVNAVTTGQVDATLLDPQTIDQALAGDLELLSWPVDWQGLLLFDRDGAINPELADPRVRQAINLAFDREVLADQLMGGYATPTSQVFGPDSDAFLPELDDHYGYDPDRARELLAEAGVADGFTLTIPVASGFDFMVPAIVQQLGEIGIEVAQDSVPITDYQGALGSGNYAAAFFSLFQGVTWVAVNQLVVPDTLYNPFDSATPEVTALIETISLGGDDAVAAGQELNTILVEDAWFAPWYRVEQLYVHNDTVVVEPQAQQAVPSIYNYAPAA